MIIKMVSVLAFLAILVSVSAQAGHACSCCGIDNTWKQQDYKTAQGNIALLFKQAIFAQGVFEDVPAYEHYYPVSSAKIDNQKIIFSGSDATFTLSLLPNIRHRRTDITFITKPNSKLTDVTDILHEIIIEGELSVQTNNRLIAANKIKAMLILQGVGGQCVQAVDFHKWLIKSPHLLSASGVIENDTIHKKQ